MSVYTAIPYFAEEELECSGTGIIKLDDRFAEALPILREAWESVSTPKGWHPALNLNSACRTPEHNEAVRGHPRSLHLTVNPYWETDGTMACDIRWRSWPREKQLEFCRLALSMGWRVGLHDGFVHIDRGSDLGIKKRLFLYGAYRGNLHEELDS